MQNQRKCNEVKQAKVQQGKTSNAKRQYSKNLRQNQQCKKSKLAKKVQEDKIGKVQEDKIGKVQEGKIGEVQ
ncbi:16434_t:CDS:2, partial [Gigaspora margarita]